MITSDERNLVAMAKDTTLTCRLSPYEWLFNPFEKIRGLHAILIGLAIILLIAVFGNIAKVYYPGVIDCLSVSTIGASFTGYSFINLFFQLITSWLVLSLVYFVAQICASFETLLSKKINFMHIFGVTALARFPYLVLTIFFTFIQLIRPEMLDINSGKGVTFHSSLSTVLFSSFIFLCYIWQFVTYFYAFKSTTPFSGWKRNVGFAISIIAAELIAVPIISMFI